MMFSRLTIEPFDGGSKKSWLNADIYSTLEISIGCFAIIAFVSLIIMELTGITLTAVYWLPVAISCPSLAFYLVFVRRWNPNVIGTRRSFRYFCSWL